MYANNYQARVSKVYGPYQARTGSTRGRFFVIVHYFDGSRRTLLRSRFLAEWFLGRQLHPDKETVDHIDNNFLNDDLANLQIISRIKHAKQDSVRVKKVKVKCVWCGKRVFKSANDLRGNSLKGKAGPFCSRSCAGTYSTQVQYGKIDPFPSQPFVSSKYYYAKKKKVLPLSELIEGSDIPIPYVVPKVKSKNPKRKNKPRQRVQRVKKYQPNRCMCKKIISKKATYCKRCKGLNQPTKIDWPSIEELKILIEQNSFSAVGRKLGVSDNAVRKRIRNHSNLVR